LEGLRSTKYGVNMRRAVRSLNCTRVVLALDKAALALDCGRARLRLRASKIGRSHRANWGDRKAPQSVGAFSSALDFFARTNIRDTSCLIVDVHMPRMTGIELRRRLVDAGYVIPTILITAYPDGVFGTGAARQ
jgi:CheY-like chemotaxis protein